MIHAERVSHDGYGMEFHYCVEDRQKWPGKTTEALDE
jgi:hypothetical protein